MKSVNSKFDCMLKLLYTILMLPFYWAAAEVVQPNTLTTGEHAKVDTNAINQKIFSVISDRQIHISGYTQFRFQEFQSGAGKVNGADLRRIRTTVNGQISNEWQYLLQVDFASSPKALDAFVRYSPYSFINLTVGQYKIPFSFENLCSSSKLEMIDRSQVVEALVERSADIIGNQNGRDIGVQLSGSAFNCNGHFFLEYALGLFNGAGINATDNNNAKDFCGRLVMHPLTSIDLGTDYYNGYDIWGSPAKAHQRTRFGLEANFDLKPVNLSMEYISGNDGIIRRNGWCVQLSYFVISNALQATARYDAYDPNIDISGNTLTNYTLGINYFINNWIKLQANYLFKREETSQINNDVTEVQLQFGF
jgi:phosphate-selective porin OprO and OprP